VPAETRPIRFGSYEASGLEQLAGASPAAHNVIVDPDGSMRRRPGISAYSGAPSTVIDSGGIVGLHVTLGGELIAVGAPSPSEASIYRLTAGGALNLSQGPGTALVGPERPTIAETEMLLLLAAGQDIQKVELSNLVSSRLGGSPPKSSHVIAHGVRLLGNDTEIDKTKARYSGEAIGTTDFSGHESWAPGVDTAGFFTGEARPDPVVALGENTDEVFLFGSQTTQVFRPDPVEVYAPIGTIPLGCVAPYSIARKDNDFYWLDHERRFVVSNGRSYKVLSAPAISQTLQSMATVSDCFGYRCSLGPNEAIVWTLPTDGRTFVHYLGGGWAQWSGWDSTLGRYTQFSVTAHHLRGGDHVNLVGTSAGYVGKLDRAASTDLGAPIEANVQTGFINRDTDIRKWCKFVRLTLRRGESSSGEPRGRLQWRDDMGPWETGLEVSLGRSGEMNPTVSFERLGTYRRRQWRFVFSGSEELVLVSAEEEYQLCDS
jgi:hypothetical protein